MTYKNFKKECSKSDVGRMIFHLWYHQKAPLCPLMSLLEGLKPKIQQYSDTVKSALPDDYMVKELEIN